MTSKQDIVVDIDEILADTLHSFLKWYKKVHKKDFRWEDFHTYKLWDTFNNTKEETAVNVIRFFKEEGFNIPPVKGSIEGIEKLSKIAKIHIVTGRTEDDKEQTRLWLKKNFPKTEFSSIEFTSHYYKEKPVRKSEVCKRLGSKIIIEDDLEHTMDCADKGIKVITLNRPWNQHPEHKNIIRVDSWDEIVENARYSLKNSTTRNNSVTIRQ